MILNSRYKSLSLKIGLVKHFIFMASNYHTLQRMFKMETYISIYLFHILVHIAFQRAQQLQAFASFCRMKELWVALQAYLLPLDKCLWIKLGRSSIMTFTLRLFRISLAAYSHNLLLRLFVPLMEINPVFLSLSLSGGSSVQLGINSFYYEYSYLSIFAKVHM